MPLDCVNVTCRESGSVIVVRRPVLENAFDEFYSLPLGGAYLGQGTTMSMNGVPWGIAVPGMGRSFNAGVTLKF